MTQNMISESAQTMKSNEHTLKPLQDALQRLKNKPQGSDSQRLFHGRGRCFDGLEWCVLDVFEPLLLLTVFQEPPQALYEQIQALLLEYLPSHFSHLAIQRRDQKDAPYIWLHGNPEVMPQICAKRGSLRFLLDFKQQNCGFFLDMEPGRQWLERYSEGASVLNLFAYTCAFSVVAIEAGASSIVNIDLSRRSLTTGRENHRLNQHDVSKVQFWGVDILKSWGKIKRGAPYDVIILDPPSFQRGSFVATKDYQKVVRRLADLLSPSGKVLACLNAPEFDSQFLKALFDEFAQDLKFEQSLAPSSDFPDVNPEQQLKLQVYTLR